MAAPLPQGALLAAAAALRLGETGSALALLESAPHSARRAVLLARAAWLAADGPDEAVKASHEAQQARAQARAEGDAPALVTAVTLCGELELLVASERYAPLRTLAEGLKVAEIVGESADAHLLAVLAAAQRFSPRKAAQSAQKALERASVGSPAQVGALLLLGQLDEAHAQQQAAELDERWLRVFKR